MSSRKEDARPTTKGQLALYIVVPSAVTLTLVAMYFSGVPVLQSIVSPRMPNMNLDSGREFGLLENLQNACLVAMLVFCGMAIARKESKLERWAWAGLLGFTVLIFLEEIDYGRHWYLWLRGLPGEGTFNLHNQGELTDHTKHVADLLTGVLFVIFPLAFAKTRRPLLRYITPSRWFIASVAVMLLVSNIAHGLKDAGIGTRGSIHKNLSEFRELLVYYIFALYIFQLVFRRECQVQTAGSARASEAQTEHS